jgi:bifunctional DNA-binding transcriptional regulator/antitoxin component of YhaV-PrlF toxin-antitoxin module
VVEELGLAPGDELRVDTDGDRVVLTRVIALAEHRLLALEHAAGALTGVYEAGYLEKLRDIATGQALRADTGLTGDRRWGRVGPLVSVIA